MDKGDASSTNGTNNNTGVGADNTSSIRDAGGISDTDNNSNNKNAFAKTVFNN